MSFHKVLRNLVIVFSALAAVTITPANAVETTITITATVIESETCSLSFECEPGSPYEGDTVTGFFTYDTSLLASPDFSGELSPADDAWVDFGFDAFGVSLSAEDDVDFDEYPVIGFDLGVPDYVDFVVQGSEFPGTIAGLTIAGELTSAGGDAYEMEISLVTIAIDTPSIPVPALPFWAWFALVGLFGAFGALRAR